MKSPNTVTRLLFIIILFAILYYAVAKLFNFNTFGFGRSEVTLTSEEQNIVLKYKEKIRGSTVHYIHDFDLISTNSTKGKLLFSICTNDSIFSFNNFSTDSLQQFSDDISKEIQEKMNYKQNYDSLNILLCSEMHITKTMIRYTYSKTNKYAVKK